MIQKSLADFPAGSVVRIVDIEGGRQARSRMLAMGMTPGCPVEIVNCCGNCRVKVRGSEVVLCCGLAGKILCVDNDAPVGPHCNCCPEPKAKAS